jgi:hypothetical protein
VRRHLALVCAPPGAKMNQRATGQKETAMATPITLEIFTDYV